MSDLTIRLDPESPLKGSNPDEIVSDLRYNMALSILKPGDTLTIVRGWTGEEKIEARWSVATENGPAFLPYVRQPQQDGGDV